MDIFANPINCVYILAISIAVVALAKAWKRLRDKSEAKKTNG